MLRDATLASLFEVLQLEGIKYWWYKSEHKLLIHPFNSQILCRPVEEFERLRGTNLAWFGVDELSYCKEDAWLRLEGRLRDQKAARHCGFGCWTPKGYDWVYKRFISGDRPGYTAYIGSPFENTNLPPEFYERLRESYDPRFFKQEALGEYLDISSGQVYTSFTREGNVRTLQFDPTAETWLTCDFNIGAMCWLIVQIKDRSTRADVMAGKKQADVLVLDEVCMAMTISEACAEFKRKLNDLRGSRTDEFGIVTYPPITVHVTGDAAGNSRNHLGQSDWMAVAEQFRRERDINFVMDVPSADPPIRDRVNSLNALLCNYSGERHLFIDPRCKTLRDDLQQVKWRTDMAGNMSAQLDKSNKLLTHASDALGYLAHRKFPIQGRAGFQGGRRVV